MYTESEWRQIAGPHATFVGIAVARDLLTTEARVYGIAKGAPTAIQRVTSGTVDREHWVKVWVSDASVFDMIEGE